MRTSSRIFEKSFDSIHSANKQFSGLFINNECADVNQFSEDEIADGNTGEQIVKTWCEELGFKRILINSINMKRTQGNLNKFVMECTQSERINFVKTGTEEKNK